MSSNLLLPETQGFQVWLASRYVVINRCTNLCTHTHGQVHVRIYTGEERKENGDRVYPCKHASQAFITLYNNSTRVGTIVPVCLRWEGPKKNLNNFTILHPIVMQLVPIDWPWKCAYYTKILSLYNLGETSQTQKTGLYQRLTVMLYVFPMSLAPFTTLINSMWILHDHNRDVQTTPLST